MVVKLGSECRGWIKSGKKWSKCIPLYVWYWCVWARDEAEVSLTEKLGLSRIRCSACKTTVICNIYGW